MKKLTTVALAGALAISSYATASVSRVTGLGEGSQFISDVQDVFTLPQVTASNPDATYLEFGQFGAAGANANNLNNSNDGQGWGGADIQLGGGVLGIWGNRPFSLLQGIQNFAGGNLNFGDLNNPSSNQESTGNKAHRIWQLPDHSVDLIYAWNVSDKLALGVGLNRGESTDTNETTVNAGNTVINSQTDTDYGINLGADIKELGAINLLQVGLQYAFGDGLNEASVPGADNKYHHYYNQFNLRVAGEMKGDKNSFQRFNVTFATEGLDQKLDYAAAIPSGNFVEDKAGAIDYNVGYAMGTSSEKGIGLGGLVISGTLFNEDSPNDTDVLNQQTWNTFDISFVTSGEVSLKDWLKARAGFSTSIFSVENYSQKYTDFTDSYSDEYAGNTNITLGLSFVLGDITIDGALNQDILFDGVYAVNGISSQLFSQVSATWAWGAGKE